MVAFPNPEVREIRDDSDLGSIWEAARVAGVKPGTIRVWMSRGKIAPVDFGDSGPELFHLPTVETASRAKPGRRREQAAA